MNKPSPADIPIIFCSACNKAPMIAKTISQHLREKDGVDIEFACPRCGATMTEKLPACCQAWASMSGRRDESSTSGRVERCFRLSCRLTAPIWSLPCCGIAFSAKVNFRRGTNFR